MPVLPFNGLFDCVEQHVAHSVHSPTQLPFPLHITVDGDTFALTPAAAREIVHGPDRSGPIAEAVWRAVLVCARAAESPQEARLLPLWLAAPRLRKTVLRIAVRFRMPRPDLEAEAALGLLEAVPAVDPSLPALGERLTRAAASRAWSFARSLVHERTVADLRVLAEERQDRIVPAPCLEPAEGWELQLSPPDRPDGLAAPLRFTVSRQRLAGERLGALAEGIGLHDIVYRARRPHGERHIGTLTLRMAGGPR